MIYVNPATWGLANAPEVHERAQKSILRFSWDAMPPLVDLRRIVLPVARAGAPYPGSYVER